MAGLDLDCKRNVTGNVGGNFNSHNTLVSITNIYYPRNERVDPHNNHIEAAVSDHGWEQIRNSVHSEISFEALSLVTQTDISWEDLQSTQADTNANDDLVPRCDASQKVVESDIAQNVVQTSVALDDFRKMILGFFNDRQSIDPQQTANSIERLTTSPHRIVDPGAASIETNIQAQIPVTRTHPIRIPTKEEVERAKRRLQYDDTKIHIAVTGNTGVGKTYLISALRGEVPHQNRPSPILGRYPDPTHKQLVWYEMPGAGTLTTHSGQYFNDQGFFAFDAIIVAFSDDLTEVDKGIMKCCGLYGIPCYLVRTKSDIQIQGLAKMHRNGVVHTGGGFPDLDRLTRCREEYVKTSTDIVACDLRAADIPGHRVYHVSWEVLQHRVKRKSLPSSCRGYELDEKGLLKDLIHEYLLRIYYNNPAALAVIKLMKGIFN